MLSLVRRQHDSMEDCRNEMQLTDTHAHMSACLSNLRCFLIEPLCICFAIAFILPRHARIQVELQVG